MKFRSIILFNSLFTLIFLSGCELLNGTFGQDSGKASSQTSLNPSLQSSVSSTTNSSATLSSSQVSSQSLSSISSSSSASPVEMSTNIYGIDVNNYQGTINWDQVKASGVNFVFIESMDGASYYESTFATNWSESKRVGILRSPYQYIEMTQDATTQANAFLATFTNSYMSGDLPPMAEIEDTSSSVTIAQRIALLTTWVSVVKAATGMNPIIYTGNGYWNTQMNNSTVFKNLSLFIANYGVSQPTIPSAWTNWTFWQFTSTGTNTGISAVGNLDLDYYFGTTNSLKALCKQ